MSPNKEALDYLRALTYVKFRDFIPVKLKVGIIELSNQENISVGLLSSTGYVELPVPGQVDVGEHSIYSVMVNSAEVILAFPEIEFEEYRVGPVVRYCRDNYTLKSPTEHEIMQAHLLLHKYKGTKFEVDL